MARWKLLSPHYLNVPDNEWEYTEEGRQNRRVIRKRFKVPRYFDPKDAGDWTHRTASGEGYIVVCHQDKGNPEDYVFFGDPTPEMEPIDAEAREISTRVGTSWINPMGEGAFPTSGNDLYSQSLLRQFEQAIDKLSQATGVAVPNAPAKSVDQDRLAALERQVAELLEMNRRLVAKEEPEQVVDDLEPLEDIEPTVEEVAASAKTLERRI